MANLVENMLMEMLIDEELEHLKRLKNAWLRYQGDWPDPLKIPPSGVDYNLKANFAREFVQKSVSYLFGKEIMFELDSETHDRTPEEKYLDTVWNENRMMTLLQKWGTNGSVTGQGFLMIDPPNDENGRDLPRIINLEPEIVTAYYDDMDIDDVYRYRLLFNTVDRESGKPVVRKKEIVQLEGGDAWSITDWEARPGDRTFVQVGDEVMWEWSFPPIVDNQNLPAPNEYWGESDLTDDRLEMMHGINMLLSNVNKIVFFDAHKRIYANNGPNDGLGTWNIGEIKNFVGETELNVLDTSADIEAVLQFIDRVKDLLHEQMRVPAVAVGKVDSLGALSGVALEILYQPLVEMTATKRQTYGDALKEVNRRLLALADMGEMETTVIWPELLPVNEKEQAETAQIWAGIGVSEETLMDRAGFDSERENERRDDAVEVESVNASDEDDETV